MKKIFIFLAALVTLFTYSNVQAGTFTFISSDMSINGSVGVLGFGDAFSNSSTTTPISGYIGNGFAFAECAATPTSVYTAGLTYGDPFESPGFLSTEAIVKTLFKPNFSGDGPEMSIGGSTNHGLDGYTVIQIYDVTAGGVPLWNYDFYPYSTFQYSAWQENHVYELLLDAKYNFNGYEGTGGATMNVSIDIPFSNVPEPATMILLGLGLIGLAGIRRKIKK